MEQGKGRLKRESRDSCHSKECVQMRHGGREVGREGKKATQREKHRDSKTPRCFGLECGFQVFSLIYLLKYNEYFRKETILFITPLIESAYHSSGYV